MKNLIIILMTVMFPVVILAQETPLSSIYNQYNGKQGYSTSEILPGAMSFSWEKDVDITQVREMLKSINTIRIVKLNPESDKGNQEKLWKKVQKAASEDQYIEMINVSADNVMVRMYALKGDGNVTREVALAVKDDDGMMLATMTGNMDFTRLFTKENMLAFRELGEQLMELKGTCPHGDQ